MTKAPELPVRVPLDHGRDQLYRDLDEHGYCVVADALSLAEVAELRGRLVEVAEQEIRDKTDYVYADGSNQRVFTLLNKGECFVRLAEHPIALEFASRVLAPVDGLSRRYADKRSGPHILLSNLDANIAGPGGPAQGLHNDQAFLPPPWDHPLVVNVAWLLDDYTVENGATRFVPGSHRARVPKEAPSDDDSVPLCAPAGSAVVFEGRVWHGTGANVTTDQRRHAVFTYYTRPYLRTQENFAVSTDPAVVASASPTLQALIGLTPYMGLGSIGGLDRDEPRG